MIHDKDSDMFLFGLGCGSSTWGSNIGQGPEQRVKTYMALNACKFIESCNQTAGLTVNLEPTCTLIRSTCKTLQHFRMGLEELYQTVEKETQEPIDTIITGTVPDWIVGSLYRNGPAKFEFGDTKFNHWFDGAAMLHRFDIKEGKVTYQNRFLESYVYNKNKSANRIVCTEFGTLAFPDPCKNCFQRFFAHFKLPDFTDNTVVSIFPVGEQLYTATETNFLNRVDPETLKTCGKVDLQKVVALNGATAHPHFDKDGSMYNIGNKYNSKPSHTIIKISAHNKDDGAVQQAEVIADLPVRKRLYPYYMHSFGMSENYIVLIEQPLCLSLPALVSAKVRGAPFGNALQFYEKEPVYFHIIDRKTGEVINPETAYKTSTFATFHHINAYEEDGQLVVDTCILPTAVYNALSLDKLQAPGVEEYMATLPSSQPARFVLPLDLTNAEPNTNLVKVDNTSSTATLEVMSRAKNGISHTVTITRDIIGDIPFDFPQIHYTKFNTAKYNYIYGMGMRGAQEAYVVKVDIKTRETKRWSQENFYPSEPIFIPQPDGTEEDDGVVVSLVLNTGPVRSAYLLILDAKTMVEIGRAEAPVKIAAGLHGCFVPSK